jgi:glucose/mannose-6-phosphate isomerase
LRLRLELKPWGGIYPAFSQVSSFTPQDFIRSDMTLLDDSPLMQAVDASNMRQIVFNLPDQLREAVKMHRTQPRKGSRPPAATLKGPIIIAGMGGSAIGGDLVAALASDQLKQPVMVWRDYGLPSYANPECILVLSSYSGNTAETLSAFEAGIRRGCRMSVVTSGGQMESIAEKQRIPVHRLPPGYPPRGALAFSTVALWTALSELGLLADISDEALSTADALEQQRAAYLPERQEDQNQAKRIAAQLHSGFPIIYGSNSATSVVALRWRGQLAENAKMLTSHHVVPEMNHNEIVGYQLPLDVLKSVIVVFLRDSGEDPRVARRMEVTLELLKGRTRGLIHLSGSGSSRMARLFSLIYLGDCVSYYAAILNRVDPYPVEMIDALKNSLES